MDMTAASEKSLRLTFVQSFITSAPQIYFLKNQFTGSLRWEVNSSLKVTMTWLENSVVPKILFLILLIIN